MRIILGVVCATLALGSPAAAVSLGEFWDVPGEVFEDLNSIADAEAVIAGGAPTSTFTSTAIDYPNGAVSVVNHFGEGTTLAEFLGVDAGSLSGGGDSTLEYSVFRFSGFLDLGPGEEVIAVGSDDGYQLIIDGALISLQDGPRGFEVTTVTLDAGEGQVPFELIYYEVQIETGVLFTIDGEIVTGAPSAVPLPPGLLLLASGLAGLGLVRARGAGRARTSAPSDAVASLPDKR